MSWQELIDFENDYEIFTEYPYQIRRKSDGLIISEWINGGYVKICLNNYNYLKHVIVAKQFLFNDDPINKTDVDHINHDKTDYHIENLRWVSRSDNCKNKSSHCGVKYEFIDELPNDCVIIDHYNQHRFDEHVFYSVSENQFYKEVAPSYYRLMHQNIKNRNSHYVSIKSTLNKLVNVFTKKVIQNIDMYEPIEINDN